MMHRRILLQNKIENVDDFYKNIMRNRDMNKYIKIRLKDKKEDDETIVYIYECFHKEILIWIKPFVSKTFYNNLLHYMNELYYDKSIKKLKFIVHDYDNNIYNLNGIIILEDDLSSCLITITSMHFSMKFMPHFIKNKIINEIMDEIEGQITHKN